MTYTPQFQFMIGPSASGSAGMANVEVDGSGKYSSPHWTYVLYSQPLPLGDGTVRGGGWTTIIWHWDVITPTQRDWLRTFCPNMSAEVFIQTAQLDSNEAYRIYKAVMIWPVDTEEHDAHRRVKFDIKFVRMVQQ